MSRWLRIVLIVIGAALVLALLGPFLVPISPLEGAVDPSLLADVDSRFVDVNGIAVHYKEYGEEGSGPVILLLHGFGASTFSWREVVGPLAERGRVIAFDRPAFGLTERVLGGSWRESDWAGGSPYTPEAQADLTVALMDELDVDETVLVGHSAGGTVAMLVALRHPTRVQALVLEDAAIYTGGGAPAFVQPLLRMPQARRLGPLIARRIGGTAGERFLESAWSDPSRITDEIRAGYRRPLGVRDWDRALWELVIARGADEVSKRVPEVSLPALVVTGAEDRIVSPADAERLSRELSDADLVEIPDAGHVPHEEQPEAFVNAVYRFLDRVDLGKPGG